MSTTSENNKRIAKNTLFLYLRMLLVMGVTLYTSRIILNTLGVEDYGIYNVVGGLASSFVFFSSSLSNATQRFLNVELGKNNLENVRKIFNLSLLIYCTIAFLVIITAEIIGIWLIQNKLVIPDGRIDAAFWCFHVVIASLAITLIGTVFDSVLIARENMKIYAYMGIFDAVGKLAIVFMLDFFTFDKLKLYSILLFAISVTSKLIPAIICFRKYPECKLKYHWDKNLFLNMFKFVGWNGFGTAVWAINEQGTNIILNMFFGPVVNAARGIAAHVNAAINNFSSNFYVAVRPQIIKSYASGDYEYFTRLIYNSSRYSFFLLLVLCLPVMLRTEYILSWWLGIVPEYTTEFIRWILLFSLVNVLTNPFWSAIQAIGKLQRYVILGSTVYLMAFPISYIFLKFGYNPVTVFKILVCIRSIYLFVVIKITNRYISIPLIQYLKEVILPVTIIFISAGTIMYYINSLFPQNFICLILVTIICIFTTTLIIVLIGINQNERQLLISKIRSFIK